MMRLAQVSRSRSAQKDSRPGDRSCLTLECDRLRPVHREDSNRPVLEIGGRAAPCPIADNHTNPPSSDPQSAEQMLTPKGAVSEQVRALSA